jgi:hypothetical protein
MGTDENSRVIRQAEGFADLGLFIDAWGAVESLPPKDRTAEEIVAIRLKVCTCLQKWALGNELVKLVTGRHTLKTREAAGRFLLTHSDYLCTEGFRDPALRQIQMLATIWPEGREIALGSKVMQADWL